MKEFQILFLDHFSPSILGQNGELSPIFHFELVNNFNISDYVPPEPNIMEEMPPPPPPMVDDYDLDNVPPPPPPDLG